MAETLVGGDPWGTHISQNHAPRALHISYGWLAYVLFQSYHLDACEQISLGKHANLSSWCLRYGLMI